LGGNLTEVDALIITRVEDDEIARLQIFSWRHGAIEEASNIAFTGRLGHDGLSATSRRDNRARDPLDLVRSAAGDENVMTLSGKAPAGGCTQTLLGADADNDSGGFAHRMPPMRKITG
jgi:hypothetical protein